MEGPSQFENSFQKDIEEYKTVCSENFNIRIISLKSFLLLLYPCLVFFPQPETDKGRLTKLLNLFL